MKFKLFIVFLCIASIVKCQDIKINYKFNPSNKKIFRIGEPVVMDVIIENQGVSDVFICPQTSILLYSVTHSKDAEELSWKKQASVLNKKKQETKRKFEGCDSRNPGILLSKNQKFHFTQLLNNCVDSNRCHSLYKFLLPAGQYECTFNLYLSEGTEFHEKCQVEIKEDPVTFKIMSIVKKMKENEYNETSGEDVYSLLNPNSIYYQCANTKDSLSRDKLMLAMLYTIGKTASNFNFYIENIHKISDDVLLINMLNDFVCFFFPDSENMKRYRFARTFDIYDKILRSLEKRDSEISDAFISAIKIYESKKTSSGFGLTSSEIKQLTNYASQKK